MAKTYHGKSWYVRKQKFSDVSIESTPSSLPNSLYIYLGIIFVCFCVCVCIALYLLPDFLCWKILFFFNFQENFSIGLQSLQLKPWRASWHPSTTCKQRRLGQSVTWRSKAEEDFHTWRSTLECNSQKRGQESYCHGEFFRC